MKYKIFSGNPKQKKPAKTRIQLPPTPPPSPPPGWETGFLARQRQVITRALEPAPPEVNLTLEQLRGMVDAARDRNTHPAPVQAVNVVPTSTGAAIVVTFGDQLETATATIEPTRGVTDEEFFDDLEAEAAAAQME